MRRKRLPPIDLPLIRILAFIVQTALSELPPRDERTLVGHGLMIGKIRLNGNDFALIQDNRLGRWSTLKKLVSQQNRLSSG